MIITLCGSLRFEEFFHAWNKALTYAGHQVFTVTAYPSQNGDNKNWYTEEEKNLLDLAHIGKINKSDAILVLNVCAYIGESTLKEIALAKVLGKTIYCLESWGLGHGICGHHDDNITKYAKSKEVFNIASPLDTSHYEYHTNTYPLINNDPVTKELCLGLVKRERIIGL